MANFEATKNLIKEELVKLLNKNQLLVIDPLFRGVGKSTALGELSVETGIPILVNNAQDASYINRLVDAKVAYWLVSELIIASDGKGFLVDESVPLDKIIRVENEIVTPYALGMRTGIISNKKISDVYIKALVPLEPSTPVTPPEDEETPPVEETP